MFRVVCLENICLILFKAGPKGSSQTDHGKPSHMPHQTHRGGQEGGAAIFALFCRPHDAIITPNCMEDGGSEPAS